MRADCVGAGIDSDFALGGGVPIGVLRPLTIIDAGTLLGAADCVASIGSEGAAVVDVVSGIVVMTVGAEIRRGSTRTEVS